MASRTQSLARRLLQSPAGRSLLAVLERAERRRANHLVVLTYHRVEDPAGFEEQVRFLAARHTIVGAAEVLEAVRGGRPVPPLSVMVTFDDAYQDFANVAWPALKRYGLPATLFVPTGFPGRPDVVFWWDRLVHAFRFAPPREVLVTPIGRLPLTSRSSRRDAFLRLRDHFRDIDVDDATRAVERIARDLEVPPLASAVLDWAELGRLAHDGVTLASHTRSHTPLHRLEESAARDEILGSLDDLRSRVGELLPLFAYPGGRFGPAAVEAARRAGIEVGFTTVRGTNDLGLGDPLLLRRNNVGWRATAPLLRARLLQASSYLNRWRPIPQDR